jgi:hypothetical protein
MPRQGSDLPPHTPTGILPPYLDNPGGPPDQRSPYRVDMVDVVQRFATSPQRLTLLDGLIRWRDDLRAFGFCDGFMWLDGSFVEDLAAQSREPRDIDIAAWIGYPDEPVAQLNARAAQHRHLFDRVHAKPKYGLDVFVHPLRLEPAVMAERVAYWFGLFSHRRVSQEWKGLVEVPFDAADTRAKEALARRRAQVKVT